MVPDAKILNEIEEVSLKFGMEANGGYAHLLLDLEPKESAAKSATDTNDTKEKPAK